MIRLTVVLALVCAAVMVAGSPTTSNRKPRECLMRRGKRLITFGRTQEHVKFPCKYNAIRQTICGKYRVTLSPTNMLDTIRNKHYVIKSLYFGIQRVDKPHLSWEGRSDLDVARKYIEGSKDSPFTQLGGSLDTDRVFDFHKPDKKRNEVTLVESSNDFILSFGLFNPENKWHSSSYFRFVCRAKNFEPSNYPDQICGNGTKREVTAVKREYGYEDDREAIVFLNVFSAFPGLVQTDPDCAAVSNTMTKHCGGREKQYRAASYCNPILTANKFQRKISRKGRSPISAFRSCVDFVCSNFNSHSACNDLAEQLDGIKCLPNVSDQIKATCNPRKFNCKK